MTVLLSSCLCSIRVFWKKLLLRFLTHCKLACWPLCLLHRDDTQSLFTVSWVPGSLTCPRSPVGSHGIFFSHLLPRFGGVYPLVTFWERVYERQLFFKLGKSLSVFILLLPLFDIFNKYQILSWKLFSLSILMALLNFLLDFRLTSGKLHVNHILGIMVIFF